MIKTCNNNNILSDKTEKKSFKWFSMRENSINNHVFKPIFNHY